MGNFTEAQSDKLTQVAQDAAAHLDGTRLGEVKQYLAITAGMIESCAKPNHNLAYPGGYADLVLREGQAFTWAPRPMWVPKMPFKACFENALRLALENDLTYCEGYAAGFIPTHHAWCVDDDGNVIDPTWEDEEGIYIGFAFHTGEVGKWVTGKGTWSVMCDESAPRLLRDGIPPSLLGKG